MACIEAYWERQDDWGEMMAYFTGVMMAPHQKNRKPIEAKKLWKRRFEREKKADVIDLDERRDVFKELKKTPVVRRPAK